MSNLISSPESSSLSVVPPPKTPPPRDETRNIELTLTERVRRRGLQMQLQANARNPRGSLDLQTPDPIDFNTPESDVAPSQVLRKRRFTEISTDGDSLDFETEMPIALRRAQIQQCLSIVKSKVPVPAEVEADVQSWAEANLFQQLGLIYTNLSLLKHNFHESQINKPQVYVIPAELSINIQMYAWKLGLSPYLKKYKSTWGSIIMAAMREGRVDQLPPPTNAGQIATITSKVNEIATKVRFHIKEALEASIGVNKKNKSSSDGLKTHITTLARSLSNKYSIGITVELLHRLALLRSISGSYNQQTEKTESDFWGYVDKQLVKYTTQMPKPAEFKAWLVNVLEIDMEDYPRTDGVEGYQDTIVRYDQIEEAQKLVDKHAHAAHAS